MATSIVAVDECACMAESTYAMAGIEDEYECSAALLSILFGLLNGLIGS